MKIPPPAHKVGDLVTAYVACAIAQGEATLEGDYKKGNGQVRILTKIYKIMEQDRVTARQMLDVLLNDDHINVRIWASAHALGLNLKSAEAEANLERISAEADSGILALNAKMTLKQYRVQGYLNF